jgi:SpoVK/Ycf46/Vps4 family AAA+-type ATPase
MIVERIRNLDIHRRPIFTGIYGHSYGQEFFVEDNLCKYNFWQELYRYLRGEGYTTVFYNTEFQFFSYEESQLETLFFKKPEELSAGEGGGGTNPNSNRFIAPVASPNGKNRRRGIRLSPPPAAELNPDRDADEHPLSMETSSSELVSHRPGAILVKKTATDHFFQLRRSEAVLRHFFDFMDKNPHHKLAVVFTKPSEISFLPNEESAWRTRIQADFSQQRVVNAGHRLVVCYDCKNASSLLNSFDRGGGFFFDGWFREQMFPEDSEGRPDLTKPTEASFYVSGWGRDEVANVLKRKRLMEGLDHTLAPIPFDDLCLRIWQQFSVKETGTKTERFIDTVKDFMSIPSPVIESQLLKMDNEKAMDRLNRLLGLENVVAQFKQYLDDLRYCRETGEKFRRHMVFMGNPGTGKTTVARIFADILREEGLLENGRLHQVTVGDLVSQFVGHTRIKAQEVCQRARGGVLFIDEAYGLYQSGSADSGGDNAENRSGRDAIEVLLQFMENDDQSLVIMAGYPAEMQDLLQNGNVGFDSRIGPLGRFMFEDYKPEVLLKIAMMRMEGSECTEAFSKTLLDIFSVLYKFKDKTWANARTAENIVTHIRSNYRASRKSGPYDINDIPEDLLRLVRVPTPEEEKELTRELDEMVGLSKVKDELRDLFSMAKMLRSRRRGDASRSDEMGDLTFIFEGNPGTGKTTVARLMGRILAGYGLILKPDVVEKGLGDIVSGIHGGSIRRVNEMFEQSIGKVLFIDEAYAIAEDQYKEILTQFVQNLTDEKYRGKMAVILAGYPNDMRTLNEKNPGFDRRFSYRFIFEDYTEPELLEMFKRFIAAKGLSLSEGCDEWILAWFKVKNRAKNANGGLIAKLYAEVNARMERRLFEDKDADDSVILSGDIPRARQYSSQPREEILAELNALVGLRGIKNALNKIIADVETQRIRSQFGQTEESKVGLNFLFTGNPGTGKTTVARLLGKILASYGLIDEPVVVTYTKKQLVDEYVGSGAKNVQKAFQESTGKVLFIDEAYQLAGDESKEALDTLTNLLTDSRFKDNLAVVLAGYPGEMAHLVDSNAGLKRRFPQVIVFEDYTNDELTEIFRRMVLAQHFTIGEEALCYARAYFSFLKRGKGFGNAGEAENLLGVVKGLQGERIISLSNPSREDVFTILPQDFPNFGKINVDSFRPKQGSPSSPMDKLDSLLGMEGVRSQLSQYIAMAHYAQENPQDALSTSFRPHMAFLGNPGTGKTTVARLFGEILLEEKLLKNNNFVEVAPDDLIAGFLGQSAIKARSVFEKARGGVLFIDEAYEIYKKSKDGGGNQYGESVVTALIKFMEDDRDTVVILAGYTDELRYFIEHSNAGLRTRVTNEFIFKDYEPDVLYGILMKKLGAHSVTDLFKETIREVIDHKYEHRPKKGWGNAREMENYASAIFSLYLTKVRNGGEKVIDIDCIPQSLLEGLVQDLNRKVKETSREIDGRQKELNSPSSLTVDLRANPSDRRIQDIVMLKERATGLLKSSAGEGTGFIISLTDRYVLTCSHVIEGAGDELVFRMNCNGEFETNAHLIWSNYELDMALLQLDDLPESACFVPIDSDVDNQPKELTELVLCGYPDGSAFASTPSLIQGYVNNFERNHQWNDRCFDTIYANVSATHGCSGGPVVRKNDLVLVGILQGGKEGGEIQFITDIHQLFKHISFIS